jgi:GlpG protein
MREIGTIPEARDAQRLADYLLTLGIRSRVDALPQGASIWVYDEDQREQARQELGQFLSNPADPRYDEASRQARLLERQAAAQEKKYRKNVVDLRGRWDSPGAGRRPVTISLVAISCAVALLIGFGNSNEHIAALGELWITPPVVVDGHFLGFTGILATFRGEWWRLVTPIFIHMAPLHLIFNMFYTVDLGSQIEFRLGSGKTAAMVVVIAVASNLCQYYVAGPNFGGMSGVVYGLFGYIWIRGRLDPASGFFLHPTTVTVMLVWFALCFTPAIGQVANGAHAAGLGMGMLLAVAPIVRKRLAI